ncbi:MAG TPA: HDOD domain-containing protein [Blastocatellia bacterium]|nr:HDOD domain-containing protein [Blastocatellia bacterium]
MLSRQKQVSAYEFAYRPHAEDGSVQDPDQESFNIIFDLCTLLSMEHLTGGKPVFVKAAPDLLLSAHLQRLPTEPTVIEISKVVEPAPELVTACQELKSAGYRLALNVHHIHSDLEKLQPLIELADFIKVNVLTIPTEVQSDLLQRFGARGKRFVADFIEDEETFRWTQEVGYELAQGRFLNRPVNLGLKSIPGVKLNYLQLIQEVSRPNFDFSRIEKIIKQDVSLSFKLLRHINSAYFMNSGQIQSLRQALALMGETHLQKWVSLVAMAEMGKDKPEELIIQAATRAKLCESVAPVVGLNDRREELFMMGMFSLLDAILDRSLREILKEIPLAEDIKEALTGAENKLHDVYQYLLAYEGGNWHRTWTYAAKLATDESCLPRFYLDSVNWVEQNFRSQPSMAS